MPSGMAKNKQNFYSLNVLTVQLNLCALIIIATTVIVHIGQYDDEFTSKHFCTIVQFHRIRCFLNICSVQAKKLPFQMQTDCVSVQSV